MRERPSGWIFSISDSVGTCDVALTKTSIMLGLGESDENIRQTLRDIREIDFDVVKFGQYLQPSKRHLSVKEYATL